MIMECYVTSWILRWNVYLFAALLSYGASFAQDPRCYLRNGGASETFIVNEREPIGRTFGVLSVIGNPDLVTGDIVLTLLSDRHPIRIIPGTKNLTLTHKLDKEGIEGPSGVAVQVYCDKKGTLDPSISIPVSIRVQDDNDNAPRFFGAPFMVNVSEVTVVGSSLLQIRAVDADQDGPYSTVEYVVIGGPQSDIIGFSTRLDGTIVLLKPLDYETLPEFTVTIRAQDQGSPPRYTDTNLTVIVLDADDQNPKFYDARYTAVLPERPLQSTRLSVYPRKIRAFDQDTGINEPVYYTFQSGNDIPEARFFSINRHSGEVFIQQSIPDDVLLQPITLVVKATQFDNVDRYALTTLTISRGGVYSHYLQFVQPQYVTSILENAPLNSVVLTVATNHPADKNLRLWLEGKNEEDFGISKSGEIILRRPLDFESERHHYLTVHASDGRHNASALINITVLNINDHDPEFSDTQFEFLIGKSVNPGDLIGRIAVRDQDRGDYVTLSVRGPYANLFSINNEGELRIKDASTMNISTAHIVVVARDSGIPPRQVSVPVSIIFPDEIIAGSSDNPWLLFIIFGILLTILILVILCLILYITKHKQRQMNRVATPRSPAIGSKVANYMTGGIPHEKLGSRAHPVTANGVDNMTFSTQTASTAALSRMSSAYKFNASDLRGSQRSLTNPLAFDKNTNNTFQPNGNVATLRSFTGSRETVRGPHKVTWPSGSIPERVKKLSWEEDNNKTELDPEVSVTPLNGNGEKDQSSLTVYF